MEKGYEFGTDLNLLLIKYKKAYDTVGRQVLHYTFREFGIPKKLVNLVKMIPTDSNCRPKFQVSNNFKMKRGLRRGDSMSIILLNIVVEKAILELTLMELCLIEEDNI
jgi:hypothetical protein